MLSQLINRFNHSYPKNFILKRPLTGLLVFLIFCLVFTVIYRPLKTHASLHLSYAATMGIYLSASTVSIYLAILVLRRIPFFADRKIWTFIRELAAIFIVLTASGISTYFMAFLVEEPSDRWDIITFLDSCKYAFLIGLFPFGLFTLSNIRHLFSEEITQLYSENKNQENEKEPKLQIISRLKKEELSFLPNHFIYA